jgi:hypothetical protein
VLTGYFVTAERIDAEALLAALPALLFSLAQRHLSTQVRTVRRRAVAIHGAIRYRDGSEEPLTAATLLRAPELGLRALTLATIALAAALLATHT